MHTDQKLTVSTDFLSPQGPVIHRTTSFSVLDILDPNKFTSSSSRRQQQQPRGQGLYGAENRRSGSGEAGEAGLQPGESGLQDGQARCYGADEEEEQEEEQNYHHSKCNSKTSVDFFFKSA